MGCYAKAGLSFVCVLISVISGRAATLVNHDFETGDLSGWDSVSDQLNVSVTAGETFNRNYAARISGHHAGDSWVANRIQQSVPIEPGDRIHASGYVYWDAASFSSPMGTGMVEARLSGPFSPPVFQVWTQLHNGWTRFELEGWYLSAVNSSFETGSAEPWIVGADHLAVSTSTSVVFAGEYALRFEGDWSGWSWNQAFQVFDLNEGDVVHAEARIHVERLLKSDPLGWAVAGIKLEQDGGPHNWEAALHANTTNSGWVELSFSTVITNTASYVFRCMVAGDAATGGIGAEVYFDDVRFRRDVNGDEGMATLSVSYLGTAGAEEESAEISVYTDTMMIKGSTANLESLDDRHAALLQAAMDTAIHQEGIPAVIYPPLFSYGYPGNETNVIKYPAHVEIGIAGWRFREMTNHVPVVLTNSLVIYELGGAGPGYVEFDQYRYCARNWNTERGAPLDILTNSPYWALGERNEHSDEFGDGPFPQTHRFVVGDDLSNFPRRLVTHYDGVWPTRLDIVFEENLGGYDRAYDKHFVLTTVTTNGPESNAKAVNILLNGNDPGGAEFVFQSFELHMGWAPEEESYGMVDYPNVTYQGHNEVFLRAGYIHGLVDREGWFAQPVARGSATIEPISLFTYDEGNWIANPYEEFLYAWPNAGSGVRSIFDGDDDDRIPGPASYHVGFKIGHQYGTNDFGEPNFPGIIEIRGNGYFRMTDYEGVMGGSLRPVAADIFGIHQYYEDSPLIPEGYVAFLPRTTPTNEVDDSFMRMFLPVRSKTNQWFNGVIAVNAHFAPEQIADDGVYIEMETDVIANRAVQLHDHGPLNIFAQVNMFWRGGKSLNEGFEGHDHDTIKVKKSDGEWRTHRSINPPSNIHHRALSRLQSNDVVYILQQDRGVNSYGFATEAPYRRVSNFEFTILDDGGRHLELDVFEQNTISEINDNIVVACAVKEDLDEGERVHTRIRYRSTYAPGVVIHHPATADGGDQWGDNRYIIDVSATDGHDKPLRLTLYYGNGRDDDWTPIHPDETLLVPESTHRVMYEWNTAAVPPGAYYIRAEAQRLEGGKAGFDVSPTRLQVGPTIGFADNGVTQEVTTNEFSELGVNTSFEAGNLSGWSVGADHLFMQATDMKSVHGNYSARMHGSWSGWSWNYLHQEIPCVSGETMRVQARIFMDALTPGGVDWLKCGVKMESTNSIGQTFAGLEYDTFSHMTGAWIHVDFERVAPVTGSDRLLLWVAGHDGAAVDVYFDHVLVTSSNSGTIVTNVLRHGYWIGDAPVDVSGYDALQFFAASHNHISTFEIWAADADGVTNALIVTNYIDRIISLPRLVSAPLADFTGLDLTRLASIGFASYTTNIPAVHGVKAVMTPIDVHTTFVMPPMYDAEGLPHYNPGEWVTQEITIYNHTLIAVTDVVVQAFQEYAETTWWLDESPHVPPRWSERNHRGDRLNGNFEQRWASVSIPAQGFVVLTNMYAMPPGRRIDHLRFAIPSAGDWYVYQNLDARAQVRVVIRDNQGDNIFERDQIALYSMDNDFDIDNDGLPDAWEYLYSGSYTGLSPHVDSDFDGFNNYEEYLAGTDPTDEHSYFHVTGGASGHHLYLSWLGMSGRTYQIYFATNLLGHQTWQGLPGGFEIMGLDGIMEHVEVMTNDAFRAYRLRLNKP
ncbi:MAG TPA: hypothetical protein PJ991_10220 [Kiritimatiellia bacterium]|nr:hypothetical protein [Kiritimatiellia bacterium]